MSRRKSKPTSKADKVFLAGRKLYECGNPMPSHKDTEAFSDKEWLWIGWMMGRADDVFKIIGILDLAGIRHTPEGDRIFKKLVAALDRKLKFKQIKLKGK